MSDKRFHISKDGKVLMDRKNNTTITVAKFRVDQTHRTPCVIFNEGVEGKKRLKIARWTIDESEFSFGAVGLPTVTRDKMARDGDKAFFTKDELIQIHQALQTAADITLKKLVGLIRSE
jgi:hypothetical protein